MIALKVFHFGLVTGIAAFQILHASSPTKTPHKSESLSQQQVEQTFTSSFMSRISVGEPSRINSDVGMEALHRFYNPQTGLWNTANWWNAANALEATIDYSTITNTNFCKSSLTNTFEKHKDTNFLNPWLYDDEGWWALTWIKAYDLTGDPQYLAMAKTIFEDMKGGWDATCGSGV